MKKYLLLILTFFLTTLTSCELYYSQNPYTINLMTIALDYNTVDSIQKHLTGTINDAQDIEQAFIELSEKQDIVLNSEHYLQIGENQDDINYPTKQKIISALNTLSLNSTDNSINIIFYSGHGDIDGSWLVANDTNFHVSDLYNAINNIKGKTLIISDSCYSGNFYKDSAYTISDYDFTFADAFEKFISTDSKYDTENIFILSASQYFEYSYESSDIGHGYFTYELLNGLGWNHNSSTIDKDIPPAAKNDILSVDSLIAYVRPKILKYYYTGQIGYQYPQVSGGRFDLVLFKY